MDENRAICASKELVQIGSLQFQCEKNLDGVYVVGVGYVGSMMIQLNRPLCHALGAVVQKEKNKPIMCPRVDESLTEAMVGAAVNSSHIMAHANYKEAMEMTCSNGALMCKGEMLRVGIGDPLVEYLEDIAPDPVVGIKNVVGSSASLGTSQSPILSQHCQSTQPLQGMDFSFEPLDDIQVEWGHFTSCCKRKSKKCIGLRGIRSKVHLHSKAYDA
ncbi:hypothetical protein VNO78_06223 [Psophocarpus tetragonolobus]|uniref:Uncharacterized protein n=1 Tax=Psophocarpus tetragonolobus TaxID=3891 RepID=A0AAN9XR85_PSOTE